MNRILLLSLILISVQSFSQNPNFIKWENCYGGTNWEYLYCGKETVDGGSILGGFTNSYNGDIESGNKGDSDSWLVKVDSLGEIMWEKTYGGSRSESIIDILITPDGGFLLGGYTNSIDGDVQTGNKGNYDFWLVKINSVGTIEWEKTYGGGGDDFIFSIQLTPDNGYILGGETKSNNGDIQSGNNGSTDFWVIKIDNVGTIQWEKTYGGSGDDNLRTVIKIKDGYLLGGYTFSNDGDVQSENKGGMDWWIVKVDNFGNINWEKTYGGSLNDKLNSMIQHNDNSFLVCGYVNSNDGDVQSGYKGGTDSWLVNIDSIGEIIWEKTYGGSSIDEFKSIFLVNDGYFIGGNSYSNGGDVHSGNKGYYDYWVVKTDNSGNLEWEKTFGGSDEDNFVYLCSSYNNFILGGYSLSNNGDIKSGNKGSMDYWVLKIGAGTIPSDIMLSSNVVNENNSDSILVGVLTTMTGDKNDSFLYTLISGDGDEDNNNFYIINDLLFSNEIFDYEIKSTYSVRIQTEDSEGNTFSKSFQINVKNLNDIKVNNVTIKRPYCEDDLTGLIGFDLEDFASPMSFEWYKAEDSDSLFWGYVNKNELDELLDTTQNLHNIGIGNYILLAKDGEGMNLECIFYIRQEPLFNSPDNICYLTSEEKSNVIHFKDFSTLKMDYPVNYPIYEYIINRYPNGNRDKSQPNTIIVSDNNVEKYVIYREGIAMNDYEKIGEVSYLEKYFKDSLIDNRTQSFSYKIAFLDSCGNETEIGNHHKTIHLSVNRGTSGEVNLYWTQYVGLNVPTYSIYRQKENNEYELINQISSNNNTYTDFTSNPSFNYQYYISFELENNCTTEYITKSEEIIEVKSNIVSTDITYTDIKIINNEDIKAYPNPVREKIIIELVDSSPLELDLFDISGGLILKQTLVNRKNEIGLNHLKRGIYFLNLMRDEKPIYIQKIVKE